MIACVAFPISIKGVYDYKVPQKYRENVVPGIPVKVYLRSRIVWGVVVSLKESSEIAGLKEIQELKTEYWSDKNSSLIRLYRWISDYYRCALTDVFKPILRKRIADMRSKELTVYSFTGLIPQGLTEKQKAAAEKVKCLDRQASRMFLSKKLELSGYLIDALVSKGVLKKEKRKIDRITDELERKSEHTEIKLSGEQQDIYDTILRDKDNPARPFLIHGITGSGKTYIYIKLAQSVISAGRGVIILVPEIALTPQTIKRFHNALGDVIAVIHSRMSDGERRDSMEMLVSGKKKVVIGVRSAVLAPIDNVGLIIVDEEHDGSYKQSNPKPRYHARSVAVMRGQFQKALVVLGSATPSFESYHNTETGKYKLLNLRKRYGNAGLPKVTIRDMNEEHRNNNWTILSRDLAAKIRDTLDEKRQIILLLNRRGFSVSLICKDCGYVYTCPHCSVSLVYHRITAELKCHQCGYNRKAPDKCSMCAGDQIKYKGTGIQKAMEHISEMFPDARIIRMDQDTTRRKGSYNTILESFAAGEADILLGTQMVAKGLDFPGVKLVGVLQGDTALHFPDFRSSERTFQLLAQVSGRAGREDRLGEVVIQTYQPDEPCIVSSVMHDFINFYNSEIESRRILKYPPFSKLVRIIIEGRDERTVSRESDAVFFRLKDLKNSGILILGPSPAVISRKKDFFRYSILIKGAAASSVKRALKHLSGDRRKVFKDIKRIIDVDPVNML